PGAIAIGIGIVLDRRFHLRDQRADLIAAAVHQTIGPTPEPVVVGPHAIHADRGASRSHPPAHHLVSRIGGGRPRAGHDPPRRPPPPPPPPPRRRGLETDPRVHRHQPAPAHGPRGVDLDHRLRRHGGVRRLPRGLARQLPLVCAAPRPR